MTSSSATPGPSSDDSFAGTAFARPSPPNRVRLSAPADILATIPFLVGYHPTDSVVVLGMRDRHVVFTARDDLPAEPPRSTGQVRYLVDVLRRQDCPAVMLVGYGPQDRVGPALHSLRRAYERAGVAVLESLRADGGRYWSYLCTNPSCCPAEGTPVDISSSAIAVAWTLTGRVARRDRAEYEAQIEPATGPVREAMRAATDRAWDRLNDLIRGAHDEEHAVGLIHAAGNLAVAAAIDRQVRDEQHGHEEVAWLTVLLVNIAVRDIAWALIKGSETAIFHHRALWQEVLHRAEEDLATAPASLFAFAAWRSGEGGIARVALQRALDIDPSYRMANLLHHAITAGLPPSALDRFDDASAMQSRARRRRKRSSTVRVGSRRG